MIFTPTYQGIASEAAFAFYPARLPTDHELGVQLGPSFTVPTFASLRWTIPPALRLYIRVSPNHQVDYPSNRLSSTRALEAGWARQRLGE